MTDTAVIEPEAPAATKEPKPPKEKPAPKRCLCSAFEVGNYEQLDGNEIFNTGCSQTTQRQFAQGHDARLVSFLVDGHFDGYKIRMITNGTAHLYDTPEAAASMASPALGEKARKATANRSAKNLTKLEKAKEREAQKSARASEIAKAKAEKAAEREAAKVAKAAAPKTAGAEVVAGSSEGEVAPAPEGEIKIKVGRWEYNARINPETGEATYVDGKGDEMSIERDGYRLIEA